MVLLLLLTIYGLQLTRLSIFILLSYVLFLLRFLYDILGWFMMPRLGLELILFNAREDGWATDIFLLAGDHMR